MKKRFLCGILVSILFLTSCEKEKENPIPENSKQTENPTLNSKPERKIKEVQTVATKHFYDDETESSISVTENYKTTFTYTNDKITNISITKDEEEFYSSQIAYEGEKVVIKVTEDEKQFDINLLLNNKANVVKREYKEQDTLSISEFKYDEKQQLINNSSYKYHWEDENMIKVTKERETINYEYYDNENTNKFLFTFFLDDDWALGYFNYFKNFYAFNWGKSSKNLVKSVSIENKNSMNNHKSTRDFEYVYEDGYVTEIKEKRFLQHHSKQIKSNQQMNDDSEKIAEIWEEVQQTISQIDEKTEQERTYQILANSKVENVHTFVVIIRKKEKARIEDIEYTQFDEIEKYEFSYIEQEDTKLFTNLVKLHTVDATNIQKAETTYKIIYE